MYALQLCLSCGADICVSAEPLSNLPPTPPTPPQTHLVVIPQLSLQLLVQVVERRRQQHQARLQEQRRLPAVADQLLWSIKGRATKERCST